MHGKHPQRLFLLPLFIFTVYQPTEQCAELVRTGKLMDSNKVS